MTQDKQLGPLGSVLTLAAEARRNVSELGRAFGHALRMPGLVDSGEHGPQRRPGAPAGIDHLPEIGTPPEPDTVCVHAIDYAPERKEERDVSTAQLEAWLDTPIPDWVKVRWIDVAGLDPWVVERFRRAIGFHTLAAEDVLHVPQRPALEIYPDHLFVKARLLMTEGGLLASEQVTMFVHERTLLTFQERKGDVWEPLRDRIRNDGSLIRKGATDFLMYALLDAAVDHCFPLLERYGDALEDLEDEIMDAPVPAQLLRVQQLRRELIAIRRVLWPTRELVDALQRGDVHHITDRTRTYLHDVYSHVVQTIDILESQRDMCSALSDLYMSQVSNRMNEIMKVLTIMASLFIPITFLAGVYGMNFRHLPELSWRWGYVTFWVVCLSSVGGLLWYFRRKGWL